MSVRLFGTTFSTASAADALATAMSEIRSRPRLIVTANVDHVVLLSENPAFRTAYAGAVLRTLDGMPLVWMARMKGNGAARRVTGHDLLAAALALPPDPDMRVFLICSSDTVGERVKGCFTERGLDAAAVQTVTPPFGFESDDAYAAALTQRIRSHGTTLLVLGVGAPKSEIWIDRHAGALGNPVVLAIGEALNVAAGLVPRAPRWMQRLGLEWLFRFAHAPQRLFRRYFLRSWRFLRIVTTPAFPAGTQKPRPGAKAQSVWMLGSPGKPD